MRSGMLLPDIPVPWRPHHWPAPALVEQLGETTEPSFAIR
ncbi:hypothetical protein MMMB2_0749 [Mycobacterium marinum MB2]|nr:hypothetical protein MMMB2_0749 [Mycobacterium marinum MB2]